MQSTTDPNHLTFLRDNMNSVKMRISELESQIEEKPDDLQLSREVIFYKINLPNTFYTAVFVSRSVFKNLATDFFGQTGKSANWRN